MATAVGGDLIIRMMTDVAEMKGAFQELERRVTAVERTTERLARDLNALASDLAAMKPPLQAASAAAGRMYAYLEELAEEVGEQRGRSEHTDERLEKVEVRLAALEKRGKKR